ncbi:MAG TPA: transposase [Saprospiraceae bacterium]|nr:transposase [Saprospiraceae bacterium]
MKYNPKKHHRRSIRLKGYDYSKAGLYFITICAEGRKCLLGKVVDGKMYLNPAGKMIEEEWLKLVQRFPNVKLHDYVVMPNHFHAILEINTSSGKTLGDMMKAFKSITTVKYIEGVKKKNWPRFNGRLWQRNYWEHIIKTERAYQNISNYIIKNPEKWNTDKFHAP